MTKQPNQVYTAAMAELFAGQGYLRKAAEIYRYLVAQNPAKLDLQESLAQIERKMTEQSSPTRKDTELLLREWIELMKRTKLRNRD